MAVGGIDPSGGAGLSVDRKAIEAAGLHCVAFVTAETDQDDGAVRSLGARPADLWLGECLQRADSGEPRAVKFGLLPGILALQAATQLVDRLLARAPDLPVVLDPVLRSSSGFEFLGPEELPALVELCRRPVILTPNLPELAALTGRRLSDLLVDLGQRHAAAQELLRGGLRAVVVKDGHGDGASICDWLHVGEDHGGGEPRAVRRPRIRTGGGRATIRGTGCRFASHMAADLGQGHSLFEAVRRAGDWVSEEISKGS